MIITGIAGDAPVSAEAVAPIAVQGTALGAALHDGVPRRRESVEVPRRLGEAGPALAVPLRATDSVAGVLVILRRAGARLFTEEQLQMTASFADQAVLAWQLAITQQHMRELDVLADRDRIARDLHDHVLQRLFAVGLPLQGTVARAGSAEVQQRLSGSVDDLQQVIPVERCCTGRCRCHSGNEGLWTLPVRGEFD